MILRVVCAWCGAFIRLTESAEGVGVRTSHGICPPCLERQKAEIAKPDAPDAPADASAK